jgi:serine/threonine-protein kinase
MIPRHDTQNAGQRRDAKEIFNEALELAPHERGAFLGRACGDDAALKERVLQLLAAHESYAELLGAATVDPGPSSDGVQAGDGHSSFPPDSGEVQPAQATDADAELPVTLTADPRDGASEAPGGILGPYKLLERIGEGGFGTVYLAEQKQPVRRKVAVKVVKLGMDTRQVIARFEAERQALALMDHPHIARVLDAGATPAGRPYFVMELVKGVPITQYCDQNRVPLRRRLALFTDVWHAGVHEP